MLVNFLHVISAFAFAKYIIPLSSPSLYNPSQPSLYTQPSLFTHPSLYTQPSLDYNDILLAEMNENILSSTSSSNKNTITSSIRFGLKLLTGLGISKINTTPLPSRAIGSLYELSDQNMVLQDISFNVRNTFDDAAMVSAAFVGTCKPLRSTTSIGGYNTTVIGFGPDVYANPVNFIPGISSFFEDGGHATITLRSRQVSDNNDDVIELYEKGNGLQFVKIGTDTLRISKAIEKGAEVKFAYGWVDLDSPGGIPYEIVVGIARDPLMLSCIRVENMQKSIKFFVEEMGMKVLPFPLSRMAGSDFEPQQPLGSEYVGYSVNSMGLLLVETPPSSNAPSKNNLFRNKKASAIPLPPLVVGSLIDAFTVVVDDKAAIDTLPPLAQQLVQSKESTLSVKSPEGYPFKLQTYSSFTKNASVKIN